MKNLVRKFYFLFLFPAFLLSTFGSCQKEEAIDDIPLPLLVEVRERFASPERIFMLKVQTLEDYPCENFLILYSSHKPFGIRDIVFEGIEVPHICITNFAPARADILLDDLVEGRNHIRFFINQDVMLTFFDLEEDVLNISISGKETPFLKFREKVIHRVPSNFIWGFTSQKSNAEVDHHDDFFQLVLDHGAKAHELEPGNYGFFRMTEDKELEIFRAEDIWLPNFYKGFVFSYDGEFDTLRQLADNFHETLIIEICSGEGDVYHNQ